MRYAPLERLILDGLEGVLLDPPREDGEAAKRLEARVGALRDEITRKREAIDDAILSAAARPERLAAVERVEARLEEDKRELAEGACGHGLPTVGADNGRPGRRRSRDLACRRHVGHDDTPKDLPSRGIAERGVSLDGAAAWRHRRGQKTIGMGASDGEVSSPASRWKAPASAAARWGRITTRSGSTPRRILASSTVSAVDIDQDGSAAPTGPTMASGQRAPSTSATSSWSIRLCRMSRRARSSPVAIPAIAAARHARRRRAALSRTSRQARRSRRTAMRRPPGACGSGRSATLVGAPPSINQCVDAAPPAARQGAAAPCASGTATRPGVPVGVPRGHRGHAAPEAFRHHRVARRQQRGDDARLLGGRLNRAAPERHPRRTCRSGFGAGRPRSPTHGPLSAVARVQLRCRSEGARLIGIAAIGFALGAAATGRSTMNSRARIRRVAHAARRSRLAC